MRKFTQNEIQIAKTTLNLFNKFSEEFLTIPVSWIFSSEDFEQSSSSGSQTKEWVNDMRKNAIEKCWEKICEEDFLDTLFFIDFLEKNSFIYIDGKQVPNEKNNLLENNKFKHIDKLKELPDEIACIFLRLIRSNYRPLESYWSLAETDFKSLEEKNLDEAKTQTKLARRTTLLSIVTTIAAIVSIIISICTKPEINHNQIDELYTKIDTIIEIQQQQNSHLNDMTFPIDTANLNKIETQLIEIINNTHTKKK